MKSKSIFLYPGHITKGLKGRLFWHPRMPMFDKGENDWVVLGAIEVTSCIHDPWPYMEGGKECVMEVVSA